MAFIKKTLDFCTATRIGVDSIPRGLLACLRDWWGHHIQDTDKAYSGFFDGIGISGLLRPGIIEAMARFQDPFRARIIRYHESSLAKIKRYWAKMKGSLGFNAK